MAPHRPTDAAGRKAQNASWSAVNHLLRSGYSWSGHERNNAYVNLGDGTFADVSHLCGVDFADDARGVAALDWDGDGDLDLWINNRSSPKARLMRNDHPDPGHRLELQLVGAGGNRDAIGARVEVRLAEGRRLIRTVRAGVNYTVQGSKRLHFGLGDETVVERLTVRWPDGERSDHPVPAVDRVYRVRQGEPRLEEVRPPRASSRLAVEALDVPPSPRAASVPLGTPLALPPDLGMTGFDGKRHRFADRDGAPLLVNLWASWCAPCRAEFADFAAHRKRLAASGLEILACSVDEDPRAAADAAEKLKLRFPAGMCEERFLGLLETVKKVVFDRYEDLLLPTSLLLDGRGRLARIYVGPADAARLAEDAAALRQAAGDDELLRLAALDPGGVWQRAEEWRVSQQGNRLVRMTEILAGENQAPLLSFYAGELGRYLDRRRPPERALEHATKALALAARTLEPGDPAAAADLYRGILRHQPDHVGAVMELGASLLRSGGPQALAELETLLESRMRRSVDATRPEHAELRRMLGVALAREGRDAEARRHLEASLPELPPHAGHTYLLGIVRARTGSLELAAESFERALALEPGNPAALLSLARARERLGATDEAIRRFREYLEAVPRDTETMRRLGGSLEVARRTGEAIDVYRELLRKDPADNLAKRRLAWLLATSPVPAERDGETALELAMEVRLGADAESPAVLDLLAAAYAEAGRFDEAVQAAGAAVKAANDRGLSVIAGQIESRLDLYRSQRPFRSAS